MCVGGGEKGGGPAKRGGGCWGMPASVCQVWAEAETLDT